MAPAFARSALIFQMHVKYARAGKAVSTIEEDSSCAACGSLHSRQS